MTNNQVNRLKDIRLAQFHLLKAIRLFFESQGFLDVLTPPVVQNPGMETHIHPFQLISAYGEKKHERYLHTSPEFAMKELLAEGFENIFTLGYCFRDEPSAAHHRFQFIMLEWYRTHSDYHAIMDDCENLLLFCLRYLKEKNIPTNSLFENIKFTRRTVAQIFNEILGINILDYLDKEKLENLLRSRFPQVPLPTDCQALSWDDLYFLLFLNEIEPHFEKYPYLLLYEFPAPLAALSTLKESDPRVCERFEIYLNGIELCNCFNELRDLKIQIDRFETQKEEKKELYHYQLPEAKVLYQSLEKGFPPTGGIALGVERLLMALTPYEHGFWDNQ